ncbi:MAG TPA: peptidylprolyl isomerase [Burkholderiales bacterium]|nr:peptidylprolyl isomerase [Burkholderiales bacterium]
MPDSTATVSPVARVEGVALNTPAEALTPAQLRQRAYTELLRQDAQRGGLLAADDAPSADGVISEAAAAAIEALLARSLKVPEPSDEACRRHYAAHEGRYRTFERVRMRHILVAVTPGVDVTALRRQAEKILLDVRCRAAGEADAFAKAAGAFSNCPSGAHGGDVGWLTAEDCAPELVSEVFGRSEVGVLPRLVHTRFGLHVIEVLERDPGETQPFDAVREAVTMTLRRQAFVTALRQYLLVLAGDAHIEGVDLEASDTPLVQ